MNHKPFLVVIIWWCFWHIMNQLEVADINSASLITSLLYFSMYLSALVSYFFIVTIKKSKVSYITHEFNLSTTKNKIQYLYLLTCLFILLVSLMKAGAFQNGFYEYFLKIRGLDASGEVTGSTQLDNIVKIIVSPAIICTFLLELSLIKICNKINYKRILLSCLNLLAFTYLFQVNYLLILIFIILSFYVIDGKEVNSIFRKRGLFLFVLSVLSLIIFSASNRYGKFDIYGILIYYPATYFSLSFSLFDYNLMLAKNSILNEHTYGLSVLGYISVLPFVIFKSFGLSELDFIPTTLENVGFNSQCVVLGGTKCYNAFGSVLFTLYRDFWVFGPMFGGVIYGSLIAYLNINKNRMLCSILYFYFLSVGIIAIMVSPFDLPYFWFVFFLTLPYFLKFKLQKRS